MFANLFLPLVNSCYAQIRLTHGKNPLKLDFSDCKTKVASKIAAVVRNNQHLNQKLAKEAFSIIYAQSKNISTQ